MTNKNIYLNPEEIVTKFRSKYRMSKVMEYDS